MDCGTIVESNKAWPGCGCGSKMLHLGECMECGVEVGYLLDDDMCSPEQLACNDCIERTKRHKS